MTWVVGLPCDQPDAAVLDDLVAHPAEELVGLVDAAHCSNDHVEIARAQQAARDPCLGGALELGADAAGHANTHARRKAEILDRHTRDLVYVRHFGGNITRPRGGLAIGVRMISGMDLGAILTAIVTPFDSDGNVDEEAFVRVLHHLADNGSHGAVVAGTTGEAPTLADDEHLALIGLAVREAPEGFKIVGGTGSNDTRHAVHLTEKAVELGVDAVLSVTPYYNRPNRRGIVAHFSEISRACEKPIILYNIPSRTGTDMPNDLLAELAQLPNVEGVKQSNAANLAPVDGLQLYAGDDDLLRETLDIGGAGGILVASHIFGPQMREMADDPDRRGAIHDELSDAFEALGVTTNPIPIKTALNLLGFDVGGFRLPIVEASDDETEVIRAMLERHQLLTAAS